MCSRKKPQLWGRKCGAGSPKHQEQVPQELGPLCISQVTEEETRRFGHCLFARVRSEVFRRLGE